MPEFTDVAAGGPRRATDVQQIIDSWKGNSGKGVPLRQTSINDPNLYAGRFKQLDTSNGLIFQAERDTGLGILQATKDGARFSPDGVTGGLIPASRSGTESLTGKTLVQAILSACTWVWGANLASVASMALGADGNAFVVTGTNTITTITGVVAGRMYFLKFASAGCNITSSGSIQLATNYRSTVNSTLLLIADGSGNLTELARAGASELAVCTTLTGQTLVDNAADATCALTAVSGGDPYNIRSGNAFVAPIAGLWMISGSLAVANDSGGNRTAAFYKGGSLLSYLTGGDSGPSAGKDWGASGACLVRLAAADSIDLRASIGGAGHNIAMRAGTPFSMEYMGQ